MRLTQIARRLLQLPLFTSVAVLTLALGIGANAAIFTVVDGVLLKPLPYPQSDRLVVLDHSAAGLDLKRAGIAPFLYFTYREDGGRIFQDVGMWQDDSLSVTGLAEPEQVVGMDVTDGLLPLLGAQPALGRLFTRRDDSPEGEATVILMAPYWHARFGSDPSVIGRRLMLDGKAHEIIGVLPDSFTFLDEKPSVIIPLAIDRAKVRLGQFSYQAVARLKDGATIAQASSEVGRLIPVGIGKFPPFPGFSVKMFEEAKLTPNLRFLKDDVVGDIGSTLWVLMGTIGLVLLIACANVANLLLVRAEGRQQELAVRAALGASRRRIAYELLGESVMLGLVGGIVGLGLAWAAVRALLALSPGNVPRLSGIGIDATVLAFTLVISVAAGLLFGLIPVLKYAVPEIASGLRGGGRTSSASRERHRARNTLVVVQVALAMVLLVGSGLMIRTFLAMRHVNPGFTAPQEVLTFRLFVPQAQVKAPENVVRMHQAIMEKIAAVPGVTSVGLSSLVPMNGSGWNDPVYASDRNYAQNEIPPLRLFKFASPGLLKTMGTRLIAGRDLTWEDTYQKRHAALVSEKLARELWKEPSAALGKQIREITTSPWREVVGVVEDEHHRGLDQPVVTTVVWPMLMDKFEGDDDFVRRTMVYAVRSPRTGSAGFTNEVSRAVWAVNTDLPLASVRPLDALVRASMARTSFTLVLLAVAGGMALLLGIAGIYGVIAYSVSQRTREIGIRMALGAERRVVTRMFVGYGLRLAAIGLACGLVAAVALTRLMTSLLFGIGALDPVTYGLVCLNLAGAAALASYVPALRATTVNPVTALRSE
ncbi:MAG TPA: ABC transporter permease [Vicinamibacterales bacterium]